MVALLRLFEQMQMRFQARASTPTRCVDALQLRVLLAAAPIRRGDPHQAERGISEVVGRWGPRHRSFHASVPSGCRLS